MSYTYVGTYGIVSDVPIRTNGDGGIVGVLAAGDILLSQFGSQTEAEDVLRRIGEYIRQNQRDGGGGVIVIIIDDFRG